MPEYIGHGQHSRSLNIHCIFSTKERAPMLNPELTERLWPFLGGIARQNGITPRCIGGVADHVHLLLSWPTTVPIAKAIQLVKAGSSAWIDQTFYSLSLWDKSHSPIEAPHNYLSAYGVWPGLNGAKLRAVWVVSRPRRRCLEFEHSEHYSGRGARRHTYCCGQIVTVSLRKRG
jgi:REP element-mobilizing transposase RayT